ncbi:amidase [Meridianimarinicoccus roseus]|uniref:Amidase n=1 Tax=Meridianimarinicoccus roseus TaxID=2072018 RepID=A0A2V2LQZ5_9RHOB|nr:amidase [Meridianimarinicoccus roseus]PWR03903.1 amidase [Meridianimarinicoccus roseus]
MALDRASLLAIDACTLRDRLATGAIRAIDLVEACLAQVAERDPEVRAFAWIDPEHARAQARALDEHRLRGRPTGPLHGVPVALKDIIDTVGIPTENGCALDAGRKPMHDAFVTERLKAAGAVIFGKTVTTELAFMTPGPTTNPHDPAYTPGGSSQGSAAAVAAAMVPLAIGTQTGGSVIRPASFCGVTGYKPTFGAIPRRGILAQSPSLDTVGVFARSPAEAAMLGEVLFGYDVGDPATRLAPHPDLHRIATSEPPLAPVFAIVQPPGWNEADQDLRDAFDELAAELGDQAFVAPLPKLFDDAAAVRERINFAEMARCYYTYGRDGGDVLGPHVRDAIETGNGILARDYLSALDMPKVLNAALDEIFDRCDAILCPAAPGPAPKGLDSTGSAIFNGLWTLCGTPAVTVPALTASNGLPMGLQLVAARGNDARLLRNAHWLHTRLDQP